MVPQETEGAREEAPTNESSGIDHRLSRRRMLSMAGGATAVGTGLGAVTGTVSADTCEPQESSHEVVFCGCSQVCWCVSYCSIVSVITAEETIHYSDGCLGEQHETEHDYVGYETEGCHEDDKILAVQITDTKRETCEINEQTVYCNPHNCAEKTRERSGFAYSCDQEGDMARDVQGGCGVPPCDHPARDAGGGPANR